MEDTQDPQLLGKHTSSSRALCVNSIQMEILTATCGDGKLEREAEFVNSPLVLRY